MVTVGGLVTGLGPVVMGRWDPPAIRASFDSSPEKVALFRRQVLNHFDRYGRLYTSQWDVVIAVTTVMEGKAAEWVADLYSDRAIELGDLGLFLSALQERFEDNTRAQQAEGESLKVKQRGRPVKDYIQDVKRLARETSNPPFSSWFG